MLNAEQEAAGDTGGETSEYQMIHMERTPSIHASVSRENTPVYLTLVE